MTSYASRIADDTVSIERDLAGPIERVWHYLTDPQARRLWLADGPLEQQAGGTLALQFRHAELADDDDAAPAGWDEAEAANRVHGQVLVCEPPHRLVFTWSEGGGRFSEVSIELETHGERVRLQLVHRRLGNAAMRLSVAAGWHAHLDILVARLEERPAPSFWAHHARLEVDYAERLR